MTPVPPEISFWINEADSIPPDWPWRYAAFGPRMPHYYFDRPRKVWTWNGIDIFSDPTLRAERAIVGTKPALAMDRMLRVMRRVVSREQYPAEPIPQRLLPIDIDYTPPPLIAVRADRLSRLWSRKA